MNIAIVTQFVSPLGGGTGTYYDTMPRTLASLGHRVWLITSTPKDPNDYNADGVRYAHVPATRSPVPGTSLLLWEWRVCRLLQRISSEGGLDVVEFPSFFPEGLLYVFHPRRKPAVFIRLFEWKDRLRLRDLWRDPSTFLRNTLCWLVMARADALLAFSDALEGNYREFMGQRITEKIFRHHGAIDVQRFRPTDAFPRVYSSLRGKRIILFTGRITHAKGAYNLLEAYTSRITEHSSDTVLVLAGPPEDPTEFARVMESTRHNSRVIHLGSVDHHMLPKLYSHAYVFVGPSEREPFGLVFAEALACGLPVISVDAGGPPEIVDEGITGILCPDNSVDSIAEALERILSNQRLRNEMADRARESVVHRFSTEHIAAELLATYEKVSLARRGGAN